MWGRISEKGKEQSKLGRSKEQESEEIMKYSCQEFLRETQNSSLSSLCGGSFSCTWYCSAKRHCRAAELSDRRIYSTLIGDMGCCPMEVIYCVSCFICRYKTSLREQRQEEGNMGTVTIDHQNLNTSVALHLNQMANGFKFCISSSHIPFNVATYFGKLRKLSSQ